MVKNWSKVIPIFSCSCKSLKNKADVAELADAHDLGSCGATRGGSSPLIRTSYILELYSEKNRNLKSPIHINNLYLNTKHEYKNRGY